MSYLKSRFWSDQHAQLNNIDYDRQKVAAATMVVVIEAVSEV